jgi:hypothetical protein
MDKKQISCNFQYKNGDWKTVPAMHVIFLNDYLWTKYIATFVICPVNRLVDEATAEFPDIVGVTYPPEETLKEVTSVVKVK